MRFGLLVEIQNNMSKTVHRWFHYITPESSPKMAGCKMNFEFVATTLEAVIECIGVRLVSSHTTCRMPIRAGTDVYSYLRLNVCFQRFRSEADEVLSVNCCTPVFLRLRRRHQTQSCEQTTGWVASQPGLSVPQAHTPSLVMIPLPFAAWTRSVNEGSSGRHGVPTRVARCSGDSILSDQRRASMDPA
jgi:hypothetical protein